MKTIQKKQDRIVTTDIPTHIRFKETFGEYEVRKMDGYKKVRVTFLETKDEVKYKWRTVKIKQNKAEDTMEVIAIRGTTFKLEENDQLEFDGDNEQVTVIASA